MRELNNIEDFNTRRLEMVELAFKMLQNQDKKSIDEFISIVGDDKEACELIENLSDKDYFISQSETAEFAFVQRDSDALLRKIRKSKQRTRTHLLTKFAVAGCAAAIIFFSFLIFNSNNTVERRVVAHNELTTYLEPILITQNEEILSLDKSSKILDLKTIETGSQITKNDISKNVSAKKIIKDELPTEDKTNTLIIPEGYNYMVILDDGTDVVLNANSKLVFPKSFAGEERRVQLKGEAYFKVAKDKKPFIVECEQGEVKVYGTEFNIRAVDEQSFEAVLVTGSVGVTLTDSAEVMITPNQMLSYHKGNLAVNTVNPYDYIQWKNGVFSYNNKSLDDILTDLGLWYKVKFDIDEEIDIENKVLSFYSPKEELHDILEIIELISNIRFINKGGGEYIVELE